MIERSEENKFINDTIDEKRNSRFLIETSSNMTYIYHAICRYFFPRFLNTFHSTRSRRKFSPPLVSNHACEFLVGPTQNRDEETKKSHGKKSMHTKGRGFQFVWIYLNQFKIEMVGRIRLKFYYLIREKKGKRYILNKDRFCRSIIFYGANRVIT